MTTHRGHLGIYAGTANPELAADVAQRLGQPLGKLVVKRFSDGEVHVQIEQSIRGQDVYIIQSTCPPVNENLMELLVIADAFHRASAGNITLIIPYYGYARQEKKATGREPITAKMVADLLTTVGADRVVSIDLHAPAIQGFFNIAMDHLTAVPIIINHLLPRLRPDQVIVSPDVGRVKLADSFSRALDIPLVVLHKRRAGHEQAEIRGVVGDVADKSPIIIDDMISTGGTMAEAVQAVLGAGARPEIAIAAVHPLLVGPAIERLKHPAIKEVIVTDTIPVPPEKRLGKLSILSVAGLLAETIHRLHENRSISALFPPRYDTHPV